MKRNWTELKYEIAKEFGEPIDMIFARHDLKQGDTEWFVRSHSKSDGMPALVELLKTKQGIEVAKTPTLKKAEKPSLPARLLYLYRHTKNLAKIDYPWKSFTPFSRGESAGIAYAIFSLDETKALVEYARRENASLTSLLLLTLNRASTRLLLTRPSKTAWLVPINMRGGVDSEFSQGNSTAGLSLRFSEHPDLNEVQGKLTEATERKTHWGAWMSSNLAKYVGETRYRKMLARYRSCWMGVCSNLGAWPPTSAQAGMDAGSLRDPGDYVWLAGAPAVSICPVATVCMSWFGKLAVTVQLNRGLSMNLADTEAVLNAWVSEMKLLIADQRIPNETKVLSKPWREVDQTSVRF